MLLSTAEYEHRLIKVFSICLTWVMWRVLSKASGATHMLRHPLKCLAGPGPET